ncbi:unnamed protein product [Staurois parvus]|uniref:Uncharacterized protein n=1 Tax=Staurois parvus TaxID=386267 RepID=A0ABN9F0B3_9NEOB|nr:unnamed protein product [Staurois parvus]
MVGLDGLLRSALVCARDVL